MFSLAFAPRKKVLAAAGCRKGRSAATVFLWDFSNYPEAASSPAPLAPKDLENLWQDLASPLHRTAHQAGWTLAQRPDAAVVLLKAKLKPISTPPSLPGLIAQLDSPDFAVREKASKELEKLAEVAKPALEGAVRNSPSAEVRRRAERILATLNAAPPTAEEIRGLRVIDLLEQIGTPRAIEFLRALQDGAPGASLTRAAKASLLRLRKRASDVP